MNPSRLDEHACPACRSNQLSLEVTERREGSVVEGVISCAGCRQTFPVTRGIARFVPPSNYAASFGFQWNIHARTQLDSHSGLPITRDRLWKTLGGQPALSGQRILEAGSGAGRFTEVLASTGADVTTFDYSSAVDAKASNQAPSDRLHFFQGDIFNIPLREASYDKVLCLGVIQHTPDPEAAFKSLAKYVRPGGQLVIDVYTRGFLALLQWKYLLRPITRRMKKETLYRWVETLTPPLVPLARFLRSIGGRAGARLVPIVQYAHLGLPHHLNVQWAILDTFDMYSPVHDHPQSIASLQRWFEEAGFVGIRVGPGPNGVSGYGTRPAAAAVA